MKKGIQVLVHLDPRLREDDKRLMVNRYRHFFFIRNIVLVVFFCIPFFASAHEVLPKSYEYSSINVGIYVNKDTTFDVAEEQTYDFKGHFHKGWRSIPLKGTGTITDVRVFDAQKNELARSSQMLDKGDSASWGKYYYEIKDGALNIEWYYDARDEKRLWTISYKVHGGISFLDDKDELYWNLFTDYDVPVRKVTARVILPEETDSDVFVGTIYYDRADETYDEHLAKVEDGKTMYFALSPVGAKEDVAIATGWPIGIVNRAAYLKDFWETNMLYLLSVALLLASGLVCLLYWYMTERRGRGRGTIIPQYEPPQKLRPAMAEVITKEKVTEKTWPATVIDLAVRGFVKIHEDPLTGFEKGLAVFGRLFVVLVLGGIVLSMFLSVSLLYDFSFLIVFVVILFLLGRALFSGRKNLFSLPSDYIVELVKSKTDSALEDYEKGFLEVLFPSENTFSTKKLKNDQSRQRTLYREMKSLEKTLYKETEQDTGAFEKLLSKEGKRSAVFSAFWILLLIGFGFYDSFSAVDFQTVVFVFSLVVSVLGAVMFIMFEARLSREGQLLKEDWLGFKLYLKTAERDRLQNLTPAMFEAYLPYAIIFGVEKYWGKAFDKIHGAPPQWYIGAHGGWGGSGGSSSSFSAGVFSASFSSSFASAFSSSGASGASGGGGSSGGGGGGGGGGAS